MTCSDAMTVSASNFPLEDERERCDGVDESELPQHILNAASVRKTCSESTRSMARTRTNSLHSSSRPRIR